MSINVVVSSTAAGVSVSGGTSVAITVGSVGATVPVTVGGGIGPAGFLINPGTATNAFGTFQLTAGDGITITTSAAQFQIASYGTSAVSSLAPVQSVAGRIGNIALQASDVTAGTFAMARIPTISYTALANVPTSFVPVAHTHSTSDVVSFSVAAAAAAPVQSVAGRQGAVSLAASDVGGLASVATSGSYADLSGTPAAYTLPTASSSTLGGIKVGEGLLMIAGVLSAVPSSGGGLGADEAIDGGFYPVTSAATITISEQPSNQTAISGAATFSAAASVSGGAISYQWQKQEGGTGLFSNVSGATSSTLALTGLTAADNGDVYQVVVSSSVAESVTSNFATLTVGSSPVASSGTLWGWGAGNYGKIGDGTTFSRSSQTQIGSAAWVKVSAGTSHSIGIKSDGTLWAWGRNAAGELGDGTTTDRYSPVQVGSSAAWVSVSAGLGSGSTTTTEHSMAIKSDGTLWGWGANSSGQLGSGTTTSRSTPAQIGSATWLSVSAAFGRTLAIKSDGTLWAWGSQPFGELGDGTTTQRNSPVQVGSSTWLAVSAGQYHTLAIKSDGTLWGWGYNFASQLSSSSATTVSTPTQIGSATWSDVSAGYAFSHAIKSDGTMWGWGLNADNQVGDGTSTNRATPVQIATGSWVSISSGAYHAMAIKSGGTLWGWGLNSGSVIQSGSTLYINSPTQVGSGSWVAVEAGTDHSMGIKV